MLTKKHVFRPAWVRTVGPGLILAMLLSAGIVFATVREIIPPALALRLHLVPNLLLLGFCARWWLQGSVVVKPNQVVLHGWAKVVDGRGRKRFVQVHRSVPRCEWGSFSVSGLFYATLVWCHDGQVFVFERLGRPDLLRKLLAVPEARFDSMLTLGPLPLALVALARALKRVLGVGIAALARRVPAARPYLHAAARWALRHARKGIRVLGVHLIALSGGSSSLALEYARFVAFCRHYLLGRRWAVVQSDLAAFYWKTLQEACVVYGWAPGGWVLHPHIQSVDDIKQRIPQRAFERVWFENLLPEVDLEVDGAGNWIGEGRVAQDFVGSELVRIPLVMRQAQ